MITLTGIGKCLRKCWQRLQFGTAFFKSIRCLMMEPRRFKEPVLSSPEECARPSRGWASLPCWGLKGKPTPGAGTPAGTPRTGNSRGNIWPPIFSTEDMGFFSPQIQLGNGHYNECAAFSFCVLQQNGPSRSEGDGCSQLWPFLQEWILFCLHWLCRPYVTPKGVLPPHPFPAWYYWSCY